MVRVLHTRIDVHTWRGDDPRQAALDVCLAACGSTPVDLPWDTFPLEEDGDHFTRAGLCTFARSFARGVAPCAGERVCVIADSTIGHHDYDAEWNYTGWASDAVARALRDAGAGEVRIDAVCGSGFVALAHEGAHFHSRLMAYARAWRGAEHAAPPTAVVFVGGWNDARGTCSVERVCGCAHRCVAAAHRIVAT